MAVSLFWIGAPYLLMGFSHDYWLLLTCAALVGIGNNLWHPTAIPLLAQRYPDRKGLVVSIHGMGGNVGDALAPLVAGALLAVLSWREVVIINVIPGIVMAVVLLVLLGRTLTAGGPAASAAGAEAHARRHAARLQAAARQPHADLPVRGLGVPLDDARRAADLPAALSRDRHGLFAVLDRRLHGGACRPPASSRARSPVISPTRWAAARSS